MELGRAGKEWRGWAARGEVVGKVASAQGRVGGGGGQGGGGKSPGLGLVRVEKEWRW